MQFGLSILLVVAWRCLCLVGSRRLQSMASSEASYPATIKKIAEAIGKNPSCSNVNVDLPPKSMLLTFVPHEFYLRLLNLQFKAMDIWTPGLSSCVASRYVIVAANKEILNQCISADGAQCVMVPGGASFVAENVELTNTMTKYALIKLALKFVDELFYMDSDVLLFKNPWISDMGLYKIVDSQRVETLFDLMFQRDRGTLGKGATDFDCHPLDAAGSVLYVRNGTTMVKFLSVMLKQLNDQSALNSEWSEGSFMIEAIKQSEVKACGLNPYIYTSAKQAYTELISDAVPVGQLVSFHFQELKEHRRMEFLKIMLERIKDSPNVPISELFSQKEYETAPVSLGQALLCGRDQWNEVIMIQKGTNDVLLRPSKYRVGNLLSQYYNARGWAKHLNVCFHRFPFPPNGQEWLDALPVEVCPDNSTVYNAVESKDLIDRMCHLCSNMIYPHECDHSLYYHMVPEMRAEMAVVIRQYADKIGVTWPTFDAKTAVIHSRCMVGDTLMFTSNYGPAAFSLYNTAAIQSDNVIIRHLKDGGVCDMLIETLKEHLLKQNRNLKVTIPASGTSFEDFLLLTQAPTLYLDMSSFSLAAGMISNNTVHSPSLWNHTHPVLRNVIWSQAPIMTPKIGVSEAHVLCERCKAGILPEDAKKIATWLVEH